MKRFLLKGSSTRNTIAGIMVTYARAPATLSVSPPAAVVAPPLGAAPAHFGQAAPSATCDPQFGQNAMKSLLKNYGFRTCLTEPGEGCLAAPRRSDARYQKCLLSAMILIMTAAGTWRRKQLAANVSDTLLLED